MEDILSVWLDAASPRTFTIKIAGRVSGGVFEDAIHKPSTMKWIHRSSSYTPDVRSVNYGLFE